MTKATQGACAYAAFAIVFALTPAWARAQGTLLPPQCAGKSGAQLDQCVRDLTAPSSVEQFESVEQKPNPAALMNCNLAIPADQGFCIAHNEIVLECRTPKKYPDFD